MRPGRSSQDKPAIGNLDNRLSALRPCRVLGRGHGGGGDKGLAQLESSQAPSSPQVFLKPLTGTGMKRLDWAEATVTTLARG